LYICERVPLGNVSPVDAEPKDLRTAPKKEIEGKLSRFAALRQLGTRTAAANDSQLTIEDPQNGEQPMLKAKVAKLLVATALVSLATLGLVAQSLVTSDQEVVQVADGLKVGLGGGGVA
jgi:hypothetical protein